MLKEASEYYFLNLDPKVRVTKIFQSLNGNNRDPEVNKALQEIEPETARFLADLIGDVMTETEKTKNLQNLSRRLDGLVANRLQYDQRMKTKLVNLSQECIQKILLEGIEELVKQYRAHSAVLKEKLLAEASGEAKEEKLLFKKKGAS